MWWLVSPELNHQEKFDGWVPIIIRSNLEASSGDTFGTNSSGFDNLQEIKDIFYAGANENGSSQLLTAQYHGQNE